MSGSSLAAGAHCPLCPLPIAHYPLLPGAPGGGGGGLSESGLGILVGEGGYGRALVGEDRGSVEKWTPLGNKAGVHMDIALRSYCASHLAYAYIAQEAVFACSQSQHSGW